MRDHPARPLQDRSIGLGSRFARGETGVAAIEFAMVVPFLLMGYIAVVEFAQGAVLARKISIAQRNLADMTSQEQAAITNARMDALFKAAKGGISPYDGSKVTMTVTSVQMVKGSPTILWSDTLSGADVRTQGYAPGPPPFTVPAGMLVEGASTIMTEVVYDYEPLMNVIHKTNIKLAGSQTGKLYMGPRGASAITRNRAS